GASVDHDNMIGDYAHISVGAHTAGTVAIGDNTWLGIGAVVSNNLSICANCMIGAGAVVVKNIIKEGTYVGVPAKKID
ncbi:MAG: acetyltransferase, partial [Pseudobutyrivibrio sp.]|nr:acetyltransferase [Pseudobutyrivibrio sp.]